MHIDKAKGICHLLWWHRVMSRKEQKTKFFAKPFCVQKGF
jgi:hypothetical protein